MNAEKNKFDLDNLVALQYVFTTCNSAEIVPIANYSRDLAINLDDGTWSYDSWKNVKIGEPRSEYKNRTVARYGIIGVYDKTNLNHLNNIVRNTKYFTSPPERDKD